MKLFKDYDCNARRIKIKINNYDISINDYTREYKEYNIKDFILKYLSIVPRKDLEGIANINIYDNIPNNFPKNKSGGYYPSNEKNKNAEIDLYMNQTLGYMSHIFSNCNIITKLKNKIYLNIFGKLFIADTLFHEIGHHVFTEITPLEFKTEEEAEEEAKKYSYELLGKIYPLLPVFYNIWNNLYRYFYKKRIGKVEVLKNKQKI